jgi:hypothetical protein
MGYQGEGLLDINSWEVYPQLSHCAPSSGPSSGWCTALVGAGSLWPLRHFEECMNVYTLGGVIVN